MNDVADFKDRFDRLRREAARVLLGQDELILHTLIAVLAGGHVLIEGVPGLGKTLLVRTLAHVIGATFKRIQFTPDLMPTDVTGGNVFDQKADAFVFHEGPVFTQLLLADEINRAPAKVQSALLEVMQERQVTIAGESHKVPSPFVVMATQNPIETEGTYALPEAQVDRFMMKVLVTYPNEDEEFVIVQRVTGDAIDIGAVTTTEALLEMQKQSRKTYVDPSLVTYAVKLVAATREPRKAGLNDHGRFILYGASPRATIGLIEAGRALAYLRGRDYAIPADVVDIAPDVLRHRVVPSYEALADGITADKLVADIMRAVPAPEKVLETRVAANA
jgi:MoxR-like ATPase